MLVLILTVAIMVKQKFFMTLPLLVSIFIMLLQTEVNRYAFLMGGINSIIYAVAYAYIGTYASAWYSFLFSFPLQIITFINWNKHTYKNSAVLKSLSARMYIAIAIMFALCWSSVFLYLFRQGNSYAMLDSASSLLGVLGTFLSMFAYKEYPYINAVGGLITIFLNVQVSMNDICRLPYLIFSIYSFVCVVIATININKLYKEQRGIGL